VLNGEVRDYPELRAELAAGHGARFRTGRDTEAVVAATTTGAPAAVGRLRGMFAFLIWDRRERVLFGASPTTRTCRPCSTTCSRSTSPSRPRCTGRSAGSGPGRT
jgi:hypothetical protein